MKQNIKVYHLKKARVVRWNMKNSCSFLSFHFAHSLLIKRQHKSELQGRIALMPERIISSTLSQINRVRHKNLHYDVMEAYKLQNTVNLVNCKYDLNEEVISDAPVYSVHGRVLLFKALNRMYSSKCTKAGIFTSGQYIFTIGWTFHFDGHPYNRSRAWGKRKRHTGGVS